MSNTDLQKILSAPFGIAELQTKPIVVSKDGTKALAVFYVDSRAVMDRLDQAFGVGGWQTEYRAAPGNAVICKLTCKAGDEWVSHEDLGSPSDQPDLGDKLKAAFSDSLKRAAVHFGIGRYLYRMPQQWLGYDNQKKRFTERPKLPAWAMPAPETPPPTKAPPSTPVNNAPPAKTIPQGSQRAPDLQWFLDQLGRADDQQSQDRVSAAGELIRGVMQAMKVKTLDAIRPIDVAEAKQAMFSVLAMLHHKAIDRERQRTGTTWELLTELYSISAGEIPSDLNQAIKCYHELQQSPDATQTVPPDDDPEYYS